ncbi:MAG TPA: MMPL family transporter [Planctomycetota bacterium]|nr:MMPL family transporter [Planctomycetota bacterium]
MKRSAGSAGADPSPTAPQDRRTRARNLPALLWSLGVVVLAVWLALVWSRGLELETSVLAMLPPSERDPALHELTGQLSGRAARTVVILVGHAEREKAIAAASLAEAELRASGQFSSLSGALDPKTERAFFDLYFPHRYEFLSRELRAQLASGAGVKELVRRVQGMLASPASSLYTELLERDPLLLYPATLQGWSEMSVGAAATEGFLVFEREGVNWALLSAQTAADPFEAKGQHEAIDAIEALSGKLAKQMEGARLLYTGVPRFAARTRDSMQSDIVIIGTGSMLGTALCILLAFRSLRPLLLSFLPVLVGTAAAMLVSFLVFEHVHYLTLVFGTSLTGLGVDYALHYFSAHRLAGQEWNAHRAMREILPGITVGVATSVLGFSGLFFTDFPVLRQFALFSSVGLIAAWATVVCWYPPLLRAPNRQPTIPWLHKKCERFLDLWVELRNRGWARLVLVGLCIAAVAAPFFLRFEDDVRKFQSAPEDLLADDQRVREIAGRADDSRFVLIEGASEQETLERLEQASEIVRGAKESKLIENSRDLSLFLPSVARQTKDRALLASALGQNFAELRASLDELGFDAAVIDELERSLKSPLDHPLDLATWLASPASEMLHPLWLGKTAHGFGTLLMLGGVRDGAALEARLAGSAGAHYVDSVRDMSKLLERYRIDTTRLVVIAYAGVLLALMLRFGFVDGARVILPSLLSAGLTLALLAATGTSLNLFHLLGLLLVLGLAVDYGVIFAENGTSEATALFAVVLSVLTTVTAFGLMVTSSAPPLRALGASVSLGIVLAMAFSPLSCLTNQARASKPRLP